MSVTLTVEGRRCYITGDTWKIKDSIKDAGGHWDPQHNPPAWWVGVPKKEALEKVIAKAGESSRERQEARDDAALKDGPQIVRGKVSYKGKQYYLMASSRDGGSHKVCTLDGSICFWAKAEAGAQVIKRYQGDGQTLRSIRKFVEENRDLQKQGRDYHTEFGWRGNGCSDCRRLGTWCSRCAFDEFDN